MADERYDVVVLGFRNELAREQVLAALAAGVVERPTPTPLTRASSLPHRLYAGIDRAIADELSAALTRLGAQVAVRASSPAAARPMVAAPRRSHIGSLVLLLVLVAGTALALRAQRRSGDPEAAGFEWRLPDFSGDRAAAVQLNQEGVALGDAGRHAEAVEKLRAALALAPTEEVVRRNLQIVLANWGMRELNDGRPQAALGHFSEALGFGKQPEVLAGLGIAYLRTSEHRLAQAYLEEALAAGATDSAVYLALAETYEAADDRARALDMLHRAREAGAPGSRLGARMQRLSREVDAEWEFTAEESRHFSVRFDAHANPGAAHLVLRSLEAAYDSVGRKFDYYPAQRTNVVLYADEDFHDITQTPRWAGAAFDGRIKLPVRGLDAGDDVLDRVVRHEYAHSLITALAGNRCPAWLNEGLAIWAEESARGERHDWAVERLQGAPLFTLAELSGSFTRLPAGRAELAYAQSYYTVWHLIDRAGARSIPRLLASLRDGNDVAAALAAVYAIDLARIEATVSAALGG